MSPFSKKRRDPARTEAGGGAPLPRLADLPAGTRIGAYELEGVAGRGGMGVVYRARHAGLDRTAAVKVLPPELAQDQSFRDRFLRESRIAASLQHPNVVVVYDAGEVDGILYIAMQYVDGVDLGELLLEEGQLEPARALEIGSQIAGALDAAHRLGLVHRDVKPANILLDGERSYLTDFGLTKSRAAATAHTARGAFIGTVDYVAPEQIESKPVDARTDVYALGCVLFHMLAGSTPYPKDSEVSVVFAHVRDEPPRLSELRPDLPRAVDEILVKALAKDKEERFASCGGLVGALRAALGAAVPAEPVPAAATRRTVLVADPELAIRALVRFTLEAEGYVVIEAEDGPRAAALAAARQPELVVADWELAGGAERGIWGDLRHAEGAKLLALVPRSLAAGATAAGADAVLEKPFSGLQLLYRIGDLSTPSPI